MVPLELWILTTSMNMKGMPPAVRTYGFTDEQAAHDAGRALKASKPAEAERFEFRVTVCEAYEV